jgi:hypothetical protein
VIGLLPEADPEPPPLLLLLLLLLELPHAASSPIVVTATPATAHLRITPITLSLRDSVSKALLQSFAIATISSGTHAVNGRFVRAARARPLGRAPRHRSSTSPSKRAGIAVQTSRLTSSTAAPTSSTAA